MAERILIVEDDPTLRRLLHDNLVFEGYRVDRSLMGSRRSVPCVHRRRTWCFWI